MKTTLFDWINDCFLRRLHYETFTHTSMFLPCLQDCCCAWCLIRSNVKSSLTFSRKFSRHGNISQTKFCIYFYKLIWPWRRSNWTLMVSEMMMFLSFLWRIKETTLGMDLVKYLEMMAGLHELIIDFPGSLGLGFNSFLLASGSTLCQLGLSLGEYTAHHMKLIAEQCKKLKILHLFFTNYSNNEDHTQTKYSLPALEGSDNKLSNLLRKFFISPIMMY